MGNSTSTNGTHVWDSSNDTWVQNPANGTVWDPYSSSWVPIPSDPKSMPEWYNASYEQPLNCTNPTCVREEKKGDEAVAIAMSVIFGPIVLIVAFVVISRVCCSLAGKWEARRNLRALRRTEKMLENGKKQRAASERLRPAVKSVESDASSVTIVGMPRAYSHSSPPVDTGDERKRSQSLNLNIDTREATQRADVGFSSIYRTDSRYPSRLTSNNNSESTLPCPSEVGSQNSDVTMV